MERRLVTYRKINEIKPIEGADKIELAVLDGWQCVVKKDEFKTGDVVLYYEIDSFCPIHPAFEFLRKNCFKKLEDGREGFRIKTIKLRGQISQGLVQSTATFFPDGVLPEDPATVIGVTKYEPPPPYVPGAKLSGDVKGNFPEFIRKTDQERIQNLPEYFEKYSGQLFEITEKMDGTSCTIYYKDGEVGVCSRNLDLKEDDKTVYWKITRDCGLIDKLKQYGKNIALQGEICGPGVQKNRLALEKLDFYLFDIFDIDKQQYLSSSERFIIAHQLMINHVPLIDPGLALPETMEQVINMAQGASSLNASAIREGIVFKSVFPSGGWIVSFKSINNNYLLKHGE